MREISHNFVTSRIILRFRVENPSQPEGVVSPIVADRRMVYLGYAPNVAGPTRERNFMSVIWRFAYGRAII